jgi:hypothetical protein
MPKRRARSTATDPAETAPDRRVRELFALPPAEFTAARDALARELAAEGSPDAPRVKRLRRPTVAIWLLNAVARERPDALEALFGAGDRQRQAQVRALRGDAAELRGATAELRDALAALTAAGEEIGANRLGRAPGAAVLGELEGALRAVATADVEARTLLANAILDRLPQAGGIELLGGLAPVRDLEAAVRDTREKREPPAERSTAGEHAVEARAEERAQKAAEKAARAEAARREREHQRDVAEAERLERALRAAEERHGEAQRQLEQARRRAANARKETDEARALAVAAREKAEATGREQ